MTEERIARNDAVFRDANEQIEAAAAEHGLARGTVPFICECADSTCSRVLLLELEDYRRVRRNPRWFLVAPGHEGVGGDATAVVERHPAFVLVEKTGHAGEIAEEFAG